MELEKSVSDIAKKERIDRLTLFFEFHSPKSFAGYHQDDDLRVVLIDVSLYCHSVLEPKEYLKIFGDIPYAELLWQY